MGHPDRPRRAPLLFCDLVDCAEAKGIMEITELLGYKNIRSVRKLLNPLLEKGQLNEEGKFVTGCEKLKPSA